MSESEDEFYDACEEEHTTPAKSIEKVLAKSPHPGPEEEASEIKGLEKAIEILSTKVRLYFAWPKESLTITSYWHSTGCCCFKGA